MAMKSSTAAKLIASDFATLDLKQIRQFIKDAVMEGALAVLVSTIIALLTRMRDLKCGSPRSSTKRSTPG